MILTDQFLNMLKLYSNGFEKLILSFKLLVLDIDITSCKSQKVIKEISSSKNNILFISTKLISPGFRIIGVSARLFKEEIIDAPIIYENTDSSLIQYSNGMNVTIVCFNLSFPIGWNILQNLKKDNIKSSIFNITALTPINWKEILENVRETKKIIIIYQK